MPLFSWLPSLLALFLTAFLGCSSDCGCGQCGNTTDGISFAQKVEKSDSLFNMYEEHPKYTNATVCKGFDSYVLEKWKIDPQTNYNRLYKRFKGNCTHISGNLIIAHLRPIKGKAPDLSFLSSIEEVSGYVMIFSNWLSTISLKNLRIIRGEAAFPYRRCLCSLAVVHNHNTSHYLKQLDLRSLRSIIKHDACFESNIGLCYAPFTVNWNDIFENPHLQRVNKPSSSNMRKLKNYCSKANGILKQRTLPWDQLIRYENNETLCSHSCPTYGGYRYCWDKDPSMCQTLNKCQKLKCGDSQRCFKDPETGEHRCCDKECAAGCHGPGATDCEACKNYIAGPRCVKACEKDTLYDTQTYVLRPNPNAQLAMGPMCVKNCSAGLVKYQGHCLKSCKKQDHHTVNNECVPCKGVCPKKCFIDNIARNLRKKYKYKQDEMSFTFRRVFQALLNCTIVEGDISVNSLSTKDEHNKHLAHESIRAADLWNLRNIVEFKGNVHIDLASYPEVKNLTFFKSLRVIKDSQFFILLSKIRFIGMLKLREVYRSKIGFIKNRYLCYASDFKKNIKWEESEFVYPRQERKENMCQRRGKRCHELCAPENGCLGPGPRMCYKCKGLQADSTCVRKCSDAPGFTRDLSKNGTSVTKICGRCHSQCKANCTGPLPSQCVGGCKSVVNNGECLKRCPLNKYVNSTSFRCEPCAPACSKQVPIEMISDNGTFCHGPADFPGEQGCKFCAFVLMTKDGRLSHCVTQCPVDTYTRYLSDSMAQHKSLVNFQKYLRIHTTRVCWPCHSECLTCDADGPWGCTSCKNFKKQADNRCVSECPPESSFRLLGNESAPSDKICRSCHEQCRKGCKGPSNTDCRYCKKVKIYIDMDTVSK